jgi:hypothetical protein
MAMRSIAHFKQDDNKTPVWLCQGAKVQLKGRNFKPEIGLFNGSMGTVIEIVYDPMTTPHAGDLPRYILVDFPKYKGDSFIPNHKTYVPIPVISKLCSK